MKRVAEEEREVALVRIDPLPGDEPDGQCDEREGRERRNQPCRPTRGRAWLGDGVSGGNVCVE